MTGRNAGISHVSGASVIATLKKCGLDKKMDVSQLDALLSTETQSRKEQGTEKDALRPRIL